MGIDYDNITRINKRVSSLITDELKSETEPLLIGSALLGQAAGIFLAMGYRREQVVELVVDGMKKAKRDRKDRRLN